MRPTVRPPAVAGTFYPAEAPALCRALEACYRHPLGTGEVPASPPHTLEGPAGLVVPHAGLIYSGPVASHAYARLARAGRPETVVLLGPDHYGLGPGLALSPHSAWATPLGESPLEGDLARALREAFPALAVSEEAHRYEHSLEVQAVFLQHLFGQGLPLLPIAFTDQTPATCIPFGEALASVVRGRGLAVVATTDLTHYYPYDTAVALDRSVVSAIAGGDPWAVARLAEDPRFTLCGPGPVMALLACFRALGGGRVEVLKYANSGDTAGPRDEVVGYLSAVVFPE